MLKVFNVNCIIQKLIINKTFNTYYIHAHCTCIRATRYKASNVVVITHVSTASSDYDMYF